MPEATMMTAPGDTAAVEGEQGQAATGAPDAEIKPIDGQAPTDDGGDQAKDGESDAGKTDDSGVPEKYQFTAPEGFEGALDEAALESFEPVARELGLTQEQADKLVALHAQNLQQAGEKAQQAHAQQMETWTNELRNDPEFGGPAFDTNVKAAQKAVAQFGSPGLKEALEESGLGNHPELVRTFAMIGKAISEDGFVSGGKSDGPRSAADVMYPNQGKRT